MSDVADKALEAALADIHKQYGETSIMRLGDDTTMDINVIPTGSIVLDRALGVGGLPRGRVVEIYGPESAGKSTLCAHVVAEAQKIGLTCAYIDVEHAMDPIYARAIGVDTDKLLISQPDTGEQALNIADRLAKSGAVAVIIIDSVAALVPRAELEGEMGDASVGMQARMMSQALRKLTGTLDKTDTLCIFVNQLREKIGVMFGSPEVTPGGRALRFYSSVRLDIRKKTPIKMGTDIIGNETKVKVVKNKVAAPFKEAEFNILYGIGIDNAGTVLDIAVDMGHVIKRGAWYALPDEENFANGKTAAADWLRKNPEVLEALEAKIKSGEIA